jgi:catechol 2,3-dioxygenase-like lactoylglutathione lyase family enzyme
MPVDRLEHVNIRSLDVEKARDFYVSILGLTVGVRPPFASTGYWLYLDGQPVVHLVQRNAGDAHHPASGNLDHVAFRGVDLAATRAAIQSAGVSCREQVVLHDGTVQLFVHDPDGIKIELNFAPSP